MAFSTNYQHDVFISYAHADNIPDASGKGWVAHFVMMLEAALKQRLGGSTDLKLFFDSRSLNSNHPLDELLEAAKNSAIFVAIASRSYASRDWSQRELEAFSKSSVDLKRLFAIECLPLDAGKTYPDPLQNHYRQPFYGVDAPHSLTPCPLSPTFEADVFYRRIHDIAEQIKDQLLALNKNKAADTPLSANTKLTPSTTQSSNSATFKRVLLAQVTDDLEEEREQVRRYLQQYGVTVLPEHTYPQGGDEFKTAFTADLARSDLFVQLLSPTLGKTPPDLPEGYTRFQSEAASKRNMEILQWRQPEINIDAITNTDYRAVLSAETVIATGFESFKAEILRRSRLPDSNNKKPLSSRVFIDVATDDLNIAKTLQKELSRYQIPTDLPTFEGSAKELREDLENNMIECDSIILIYSKSTQCWLSGQKKQYNKIVSSRLTEPRIFAVYIGSPIDKPDIPFYDPYPYFKIVDCRTTDDLSPVVSLLSELYQ